MKNSRWLLFALCLPWTLTVSYPLICLFKLLGWVHSVRWGKFGVLMATWSDKVAKKWKYSNTFGHAVVFFPGLGPEDLHRVEKHEDVHVRQMEDNLTVGFLLFLLLSYLGHGGLGLLLWWGAGTWLGVSYLTSGVRWGWKMDSVYRNAEHERSAYAQTDKIRDKGSSWEDLQGDT